MTLIELNEKINLSDCPCCGGPGILEEEGGWAFTVQCADCGAQTAVSTYTRPEDREEAAQRAAYTWNLGKVVRVDPGE